MSIQRWMACVLLGVVLFVVSGAAVKGALTASNVLVLYNQNSPDGAAIADYYAQAHPGVKLLGLTNVGIGEEISASDYLSTIRPQVLSSLTSDIDVIVTTKGLPLRIVNSSSGSSSYRDPFNVLRSIPIGGWKRYSSLESELTRIDTIGTLQQMGDNNYLSSTGKPSFSNPSLNSYYASAASASVDFDYANYYKSYSYSGTVYGGIRLSSRLDGYTVADVQASIDRAQNAVVLPKISKTVLDDDPNTDLADQMATLPSIFAAKNQTCVYDNTSNAVTSVAGPVIGYVSHGVHAGLPSNYVASQLNFTLAPGAVFATHESYNAYSFQAGGSTMGQGQLAQWLAIGGTVGVGNVQEPNAGASYEANEDKIFKMLLDGKTWAEAAWSSIKQLSYVTTVVGDPLMTWRQIQPGDVNMDNVVDATDFAVLTQHWGAAGAADGSLWTSGDLNCDGVVDVTDVGILQSCGINTSEWAAPPILIPEPSAGILLTCVFVAGLCCAAFRRRK
jgi:uncharacterized protein (TIGR03790 family)